MKNKLTVGHALIIVILVLLSLICLYPLWYTIVSSFSAREYIATGRAWIWPKGFHLVSYKKILEDAVFLKCTWVSIKRVLIGCTLNIFLLVITSYPLAMPERKFPAHKYVIWFFMINMYISGGMIPSFMLMKQYGLMNSFWVMVIPGAFPIGNLVLMINFFRTIPYDLCEAADIDGSSPMRTLFNVYLPLSKPGIATMLLYSFCGHWNGYMDGLIYIQKLEDQPLQTYIYQLSAQIDFKTMTSEQIIEAMQTSNESFNAAKILIALLPIMAVYPMAAKYFTKGIVIGAVKG